jgi:hypothetical protein
MIEFQRMKKGRIKEGSKKVKKEGMKNKVNE